MYCIDINSTKSTTIASNASAKPNVPASANFTISTNDIQNLLTNTDK